MKKNNLFVNFLIINNIFEIYKYNFKNKRSNKIISDFCFLRHINNYKESIGAIDAAFTWYRTQEGNDFWSSYNILWIKFIKKHRDGK